MPLQGKGRGYVRRLCMDAMLLGVCLLLSYLEHLLPLDVVLPLPGVRLGWAQLGVTFTYFYIGRKDAAAVSAVRVILMALLFGTPMSFCFSACGALLSYGGLVAGEMLLRRYCSYLGLGVACAVLHNVGQAVAASLFFGVEVMVSYLPVLLLAGILTGAFGGAVLNGVASRLSPTGKGGL